MASYSFLHIGKTGGTTIKALIRAHKKRHPSTPIKAFKHDMTLARFRDERPDDLIFFFVRDPVMRYVSGFNSRLRQGQPLHNNPWTPQEEAAFRRFPSPNALAEAITSLDSDVRAAAIQAMHDIVHVRFNLTHYLGSVSLLEEMAGRICFIGDLASFNDDLAALRRLLRIDPDLEPPTDDIGTHRTPEHMSRELSNLGEQNIRTWLTTDFALHGWCVQRRVCLCPSDKRS